MPSVQEIIHKVEVAGGMKYIRIILGVLAAVFVIIAYNLRVAKNMGTQEAMDAAQLARNISEGKGYTTSFVRPFSFHLIREMNESRKGLPTATVLVDYGRLKEAHPDISNPPVYPVVLAGLMKVLPFKFQVSKSGGFWSENGRPVRYEPDYLIGWFNQLLLLGVIVLTFFWARRLFDTTVAATAALLLFGSELLWRFSASGLSTMLLLLIFMGIVWCLTLLEQGGSQETTDPLRLLILSAVTGLLVGAGGLTRYGFAIMIVPTVVFVVLFCGSRRVVLSLACFLAFAAVMTPWVIRNLTLSGAPFGTAGYAVLHGASTFSENQLERSLDPNVHFLLRPMIMKLLVNSRHLLEREFFTTAGGWLMALFLAGLLLGFRSLTIRRIRYYLLGGLGLLFVMQALGRTQLTEDSPVINSENYLVVLAPLIVVYSVGFFYALLDQLKLDAIQLRWLVIAVFGGLACLPMILALMPPRHMPVVYPPYYPPAIQEAASYLKPGELMMSDIPWAVAWYGKRQCMWLTLEAENDPQDTGQKENVFTINDFEKPINGLYLTPRTLDMRFGSDMVRGGRRSWGNLILNIMLRKEVPKPFPLREIVPEFLPEQLFITDWKRSPQPAPE